MTVIKTAVTLDNADGELLRTPKEIQLKSIDDVRLQMATLFREAKAGKIETSDATKLCYILAQIGKMISEHELEKRIEALEAIANDDT